VEAHLSERNVKTRQFNGSLLFSPTQVETQQGGPYKVFTPFWRQCLAEPEPGEPLPPPAKLPAPSTWPSTLSLDDLDLEPALNWTEGLAEAWEPGEAGAGAELERFLDEALHAYATDRDRPDRRGTSRLSPYLHFGEISPRTIWHAVKEHAAVREGRGLVKGAESYLREVGWREFAHHLLHHFPDTVEEPLRPEFSDFPWADDEEALMAWQRGQTGFPIVDAGMRELWATGWMHNRVRMIVGSFLVKDLLIPWQEGARWFWDTLVDADLANNTLGWQWVAGCGADAAPYFRVFNPILQGKKYDPDGAYVSRWVPELAGLPVRWIHEPWNASAEILEEAGVELGSSYPHPLVDHGEARDRALEAYSLIKKG
jgi:deoxyribodipyrimidine photo-lyase